MHRKSYCKIPQLVCGILQYSHILKTQHYQRFNPDKALPRTPRTLSLRYKPLILITPSLIVEILATNKDKNAQVKEKRQPPWVCLARHYPQGLRRRLPSSVYFIMQLSLLKLFTLAKEKNRKQLLFSSCLRNIISRVFLMIGLLVKIF